jgi:hypothetical protein
MNSELETIENDELVEKLSAGSIPAKYDRPAFKKLVAETLREVGPTIAKSMVDALRDDGDTSLEELWNTVSQLREVQERFVQASRQIDAMAVLFVRSKFENNTYIGTEILRVSLEAELKKMDPYKLLLHMRGESDT